MEKALTFVRDNNIFFITIVAALIFYAINPRFLGVENVSAISRQIVPIGLVVLGQFFVIVSGNIDLSMGMASVLFSIVLGVLFGVTGGVVWGVICVVAASLVLGLINGYVVSTIDRYGKQGYRA